MMTKQETIEIVDRIKSVAASKGVKLKHLTDKMGSYKQRFAECRNGKSSLSDDEIKICAKELGVSFDWLKTGNDNDYNKHGIKQNTSIELGEKEIMFALLDGDADEITDDMYEEIKTFAKFLAQQRRAKKDGDKRII